MNQIVTVAKIAGEASKVVLRAFRHWSEARITDKEAPTLMESAQWPPDCLAEMRHFAQDIRANAGQPPILFWNEHRDMWSMDDVFRRAFPTNGNRLYEVMSDDAISLFCYSIPDGNALRDHLSHELNRKHFADETKWYLRVVREAVSAWHSVAEEAAIVVMRQVVGGLKTDDDVEETLDLIPNWLSRNNKD